MNSFSDFHLPKALADALEQLKFTTPTPIQAAAIPPALKGRDVLGSAQTGTGKTAAFMLPLLAKLLEDERAQGLVMCPTRELAGQVLDMTRKLMGHNSGIRTALLIGGEPMPKQFKQLNNRPRLIIGTPGRIDDHCRRNNNLLDSTRFLVLDEADRMLDMGFSTQIDAILKYMPRERQTLMFSATFADNILRFAQKYLNNPVRVAIKAEKMSADKIKHEVLHTTLDKKFEQLQSELSTREGSVIIFVKTRRNADKLAKQLSYIEHNDFRAEPIHGDLRQRQRDRTIADFRSSRFRILVATDVASRGLDIPHIEHVINYDLPQNPEDYVHRIGRTARAGAEGSAVCLLTPGDHQNWRIIQRMVFPGQVSDVPAASNTNFKKGGKKPYAGRSNDSDRYKPRRSENGERPQRSFDRTERPARSFDRSERSARPNDRPHGDKPPFKKRFDNRTEKPAGDRDGNRADARPDDRFNHRPDNRPAKPAGERGEFKPKKRSEDFKKDGAGKPSYGKKPAWKGAKPAHGKPTGGFHKSRGPKKAA